MDQLIKNYIKYVGIGLVLLLSLSSTAQKTSLAPVDFPAIKRNGYEGGLSVQVQVIPPDGTIELKGKSNDFEVLSDKETIEEERYRINLKIKNSSKDDKVKWVIRKDDIISSRYLRPNNLPVKECTNIPFENSLLISYLIKGEATDGRAPLKLKLWLLHINNDCPQAVQQPYVLSLNYQIKTKKPFIPEPKIVEKKPEPTPKEIIRPTPPRSKAKETVAALNEKEEWRKTEEENSVKAYEAFIEEFPDSDLAETARLRKEPITYTLNKTDDPLVWEVQLKNTISPFVQVDTTSEIKIIEKTPEAFTVILPYLYKEYKLKIIDENKAVGQQIMAITLHPEAEPIEVQVDSLEIDSLLITITGGTKPYLITLRDSSDHTILVTSDLGDSTYTFVVSEQREHLQLSSGTYTFNVVDKGWQEPSKIAGRQMVTIEPVYLPWDYIITIGGAFIAVLALISVIRSARKRRKRRKMEAGREKIMEQMANMEQQPQAEVRTEYTEPEDLLEQATTTVGVKNKIKIKGIKKRQEQIMEIRGGDFYANSGQYFALYMEQLWQDSVIEKLFFSKESIKDLDEFVQTQNLLIFDENENGIPEIGGLLIGKVGKENYSGIYQVAVEKFEPIKASFQNTIRLEYSVEDLARVFGEMDDKHPDLTLVGWFHTHPGHGLFLSQPDLVIQNNYFDKPFQFAMEMDTKTQRLDTGFFTWKKANQGINNTKNLKTGTEWFSWTELEQFV